MFSKTLIYLSIFLISLSSIYTQQLEWVLLSDGSSMDTPEPRRDAALGFDQTFLILYGGRGQDGEPKDDSRSFNVLTGNWDTLNFPSPPPARYGMASANSINGGLYIFGGFSRQGSSENYNPYIAYAAGGQSEVNYNYATPPNFMQNPILMNNPDFVNNPNYNPMSGTGYNRRRTKNLFEDNDREDDDFYPLQDAWFLNYGTKIWQQTQSTEYARGFGSAAASVVTAGTPKVLYTMGKSRDWMYSLVESIGEGTSGLSQSGTMQSSIIMYDLPSLNPSYPHARYGHSTTLLTDNHLLLFGGCLSGYGKGGPCPSKDSWLLTIDKGDWERLGECPTTKTGAAMVTVPAYSTCAAMGQNAAEQSAGMAFGSEPAIAVLWGGREKNPSSIRTYPSPRDEIAVFSLEQKEWQLKRAAPWSFDGSYPMQREGAAYVGGCFNGVPGMFIFGGRAVADRRLLSDLWFLKVIPQEAMNAPESRGCIYPFSYYHLHGIFQFFTYGVIFPIGYLIGRHVGNLPIKRSLHMGLQIFGVALAICGFSFGVHSVRAPHWLHFRHAHAIIGIITFILTIFQFLVGLLGAVLLKRRSNYPERLENSPGKIRPRPYSHDMWAGEGAWRIIHRILGSLVLALGLINISLGVFLAVLPLAVWVVWYVYMSILVIIIFLLEILACFRHRGVGKGGSLEIPDKREDPKGTSQSSLKYSEDPTDKQSSTVNPSSRRNPGRIPPLETTVRENGLYRRNDGVGRSNGDDRIPLILDPPRRSRPGDVNASASLPQYDRSNNQREYTIPTRKRSEPGESGDAGYYVGRSPEHEQSLPQSSAQQQSEQHLTRVRLQ